MTRGLSGWIPLHGWIGRSSQNARCGLVVRTDWRSGRYATLARQGPARQRSMVRRNDFAKGIELDGAFMSEIPTVLDVAAIGKVVRDELDRQNKYLEFAQGQIEKDRSFYRHLYTYAGAFLAFMVGVAGYFSYTSVSQMRADMKASVDAELVLLRAQAEATSSEAQDTVKRELANVRTEVQKRIDSEFRTDNIAALVASAVKQHTDKELSGIIRSETATQVAGDSRSRSSDPKEC
jgi:hypothetical protein